MSNMQRVRDFYCGKNVIVTGGLGFVGSHLVEQLVDLCANVKVLDNMSRGKFHTGQVEFVYADVSNEGELRYNLPSDTFAIFNLAATVAGVFYNDEHHYEMFSKNFGVLAMPVKIAAEYGIPHFLQVSSQCIYPDGMTNPCIEDNAFSGEPNSANIGYSTAKRCGEYIARWSALPRTVIVRPTNIYGPRDYFDGRAHVIPALIRKCVHDDEIFLYGTGKERREFLYVDDAAKGMLYALALGKDREAYNLGTGGATCRSIRGTLEMIREATGARGKPVVIHPSAGKGDSIRWSDCEKIEALGFRHDVGLAEGIKRTVEWYNENNRHNI